MDCLLSNSAPNIDFLPDLSLPPSFGLILALARALALIPSLSPVLHR